MNWRAVLVALVASAISLTVWRYVGRPKNVVVARKISVVALSKTGQWLAVGTPQGEITIWRGDPARVHIQSPGGPLNDLQFSPDERSIAIADRNLSIGLIGQTPRLLRSDSNNYGTVRFSGDGKSLLTINGASVIDLLDVQSGASRFTICCSTIYGEVGFTPDGSGIVNAGHWPGLWDASSGKLIAHFMEYRQTSTFGPIAFDRDRDAVYMGSQDGRVYGWNLATRESVSVPPSQSDYVDALAITPTGWIVYAGFGKSLRAWNSRTGQYRSFAAARPTSNLVLSSDGASVLFGTADGAIEEWDVAAEKGRRVH